MEAHEPRLGMLVCVRAGHWKSQFGGMVGVVEQRWGDSDYPALDVRLEDGRLELFWFHELDEADAGSATLSLPYYDGS